MKRPDHLPETVSALGVSCTFRGASLSAWWVADLPWGRVEATSVLGGAALWTVDVLVRVDDEPAGGDGHVSIARGYGPDVASAEASATAALLRVMAAGTDLCDRASDHLATLERGLDEDDGDLEDRLDRALDAADREASS